VNHPTRDIVRVGAAPHRCHEVSLGLLAHETAVVLPPVWGWCLLSDAPPINQIYGREGSRRHVNIHKQTLRIVTDKRRKQHVISDFIQNVFYALPLSFLVISE